MNKVLSISLLGLFVFILRAPAVSAGGCYVDPVIQYSGTGKIVSAVFLRSEACTSGTVVLKTLSAGSVVEVVGFTDGWYEVISGGKRGWIGQQFLQNNATQTGVTYSNYEAYRMESSGSPTAAVTTAAPVTVEAAYTGVIGSRDLIKLVCPSNAGVDHPCKAVYYIGADAKRHAFPNGRVFGTWYANFNNVKAVTAERLGQFALGTNITYRPGARMVKFTTDPKVYAVARGGVLRWVKTEALATAYYGTDWNKKVDDIPDAFYSNYAFGSDISAESEYSPTAELDFAPTFD